MLRQRKPTTLGLGMRVRLPNAAHTAPQRREPGTVRWVVTSIVVSAILTVLLNVGLKAFPNTGRRLARSLTMFTSPTADGARTNDRRVRVCTPWKAMVLGSLILTVLVNVVLWIA